jgi:Flp pilus assembly protein TadD
MPRCLLILLTSLVVAGCLGRGERGADAEIRPGADRRRDTATARQENEQAARLLTDGKYDQAEAHLKAALAADITYGPAHNNLGKVYYHQSKLYQAAWEFEYAAKLMPGQPEPRNNLGLVLESVGRLDEAADLYGEAHAMEPGNSQFIGNLARARVQLGDRGPQVRELLSKLIMSDSRPEWVEWARERLMTMTTATTEQPIEQPGN